MFYGKMPPPEECKPIQAVPEKQSDSLPISIIYVMVTPRDGTTLWDPGQLGQRPQKGAGFLLQHAQVLSQ